MLFIARKKVELLLKSIIDLIESFSIEKQLRRIGVHHISSIHTYTSKKELETLFVLAANIKLNSQALEIGSYMGASTCYIAAGLIPRKCRLFCLDTWNNETMPEGIRDTYSKFAENISSFKQHVEVIRKRSDEVTSIDLPSTLSFVFIDGDHSYPSVKGDFKLVENLVEPGGIVAFHDTTWFPGVSKIVGEALASEHWILGGLIESVCWIRKLG